MILKRLLPFILIILVVTAVLPSQFVAPVGRVAAQGGTPDPSGVPVVIKGVVQSISGNTMTVAGVTVILTQTTVITGFPQVGNIVEISGNRQSDGTVVVITVVLNPATPAPTMSATEEGTEAPEGTKSPTPAGTMAPTAAGTQPGVSFTTIIIEGPVEAIIVNTGTVVVVFGQHIRLRDDDPLKLKIKIGDWIHLKGHFEDDDQGQIIIVADIVVIIIEPAPVIIVPSGGGGNTGGGNGHHDDD